MNVIVEIGHPAHVYNFKYIIQILQSKGHQVRICAFDKDLTLALLTACSFQYEALGKNRSGNIFKKIWLLVRAEYRMWRTARQFKPDLFLSRSSPVSAHVSRILGKKHIIFNDTECALLANAITTPFCDAICTPTCFKRSYGKKHVRFESYKELAYLHPDYFKPDPAVLSELGLSKSDRFVIIRFVAWQATHDIGHHGFDKDAQVKLVRAIEKQARVFITSEKPLPPELENYRITSSPEKIHDLLYYATMLIGDTQTMTTEAAVLGTPAIRCNSFIGPNDMGNFQELESKYDLIYSFREPDDAINKAMELLIQPDLKQKWAEKRRKLLAEKIDITRFMVEFIEGFPRTFDLYRQAGITLNK